MEFKHIIFDMDGTTLDSMQIWDKVTMNFMNRMGYPVTKDYLDDVAPLSVSEAAFHAIEKFNLPIKPQDLVRGILDEASGHYYNTLLLKPYAKEFIEKMHGQGVKMCVATASPRDFAVAAFKRTGVLDFFEFIITNDDVGVDKNRPDIYIKSAEMMDSEISDTTVFEDAAHCVKTAKKAGFKVVGVADPSAEHKKAEIMETVDLYINSYKELL